MKTVYRISLPNNDFEGGVVETNGYLRIPPFDCQACECDGSTTDVWYASLDPVSQEAIEFVAKGLPEKAGSYEEYVVISNKVRDVFRSNVRLLPGSIVGARPIETRSKGFIGELTTKKLKEGIDFISAGTSWIVSEKVFDLMQQCKIKAAFGSVVFKTADREFTGYRVIEAEPQPIWTKAERIKYGLSLCDRCGSSFKKSSKGTFAMKQFDGSCFRDGYALVRGAESRSLFVNEALYQQLTEIKPNGASFDKEGEWL